MEREELLRNLKQVREKEKDRKYSVGQLNVFDMVSDVINYLEHEEKPKMTNLEWLQKAGMITINCAFNKECEEIEESHWYWHNKLKCWMKILNKDVCTAPVQVMENENGYIYFEENTFYRKEVQE